MTIRESLEQMEIQNLSPYAAHSAHSVGRDRPEEECDIRTVYQRDRDRILHCKAFRRMKDKTQVFLDPEGDHYRTRRSLQESSDPHAGSLTDSQNRCKSPSAE